MSSGSSANRSAGARSVEKLADHAVRHDHDERRRQMASRILRDLPLEIAVEGVLAADETGAVVRRAEQLDPGPGGRIRHYKSMIFL